MIKKKCCAISASSFQTAGYTDCSVAMARARRRCLIVSIATSKLMTVLAILLTTWKIIAAEIITVVGAKLHPDDIGYVLSVPTVPEFLTGREFIKFYLDINSQSIANPKSIDEYFDYVRIDKDDRDKLLKDYSHGMKNKMQMLINFISQPDILLLDEPLTSLDVVVAEEMKQLLRTQKEGRVLILSTHILDLALDLCDEIVLLNHGELESVDKTNLDSHEFKEKIISALMEDENA